MQRLLQFREGWNKGQLEHWRQVMLNFVHVPPGTCGPVHETGPATKVVIGLALGAVLLSACAPFITPTPPPTPDILPTPQFAPLPDVGEFDISPADCASIRDAVIAADLQPNLGSHCEMGAMLVQYIKAGTIIDASLSTLDLKAPVEGNLQSIAHLVGLPLEVEAKAIGEDGQPATYRVPGHMQDLVVYYGPADQEPILAVPAILPAAAEDEETKLQIINNGQEFQVVRIRDGQPVGEPRKIGFDLQKLDEESRPDIIRYDPENGDLVFIQLDDQNQEVEIGRQPWVPLPEGLVAQLTPEVEPTVTVLPAATMEKLPAALIGLGALEGGYSYGEGTTTKVRTSDFEPDDLEPLHLAEGQIPALLESADGQPVVALQTPGENPRTVGHFVNAVLTGTLAIDNSPFTLGVTDFAPQIMAFKTKAEDGSGRTLIWNPIVPVESWEIFDEFRSTANPENTIPVLMGLPTGEQGELEFVFVLKHIGTHKIVGVANQDLFLILEEEEIAVLGKDGLTLVVVTPTPPPTETPVLPTPTPTLEPPTPTPKPPTPTPKPEDPYKPIGEGGLMGEAFTGILDKDLHDMPKDFDIASINRWSEVDYHNRTPHYPSRLVTRGYGEISRFEDGIAWILTKTEEGKSVLIPVLVPAGTPVWQFDKGSSSSTAAGKEAKLCLQKGMNVVFIFEGKCVDEVRNYKRQESWPIKMVCIGLMVAGDLP